MVIVLYTSFILINDLKILNNMGDINFEKEIINSENFELYFAPNKENVDKVINLINNSKKEINCALRALNHKELEITLKKKEKEGIKVRLYIDSDYMGNKEIYLPYTRFSPSEKVGMMHNNYCIIDKSKVFTGSTIFNLNTLNLNFHDILIINSEELAKEYNSDFWKMYNGEELDKEDYNKNFIRINENLFVKPCFAPYQNCKDLIIDSINKSENEINFATYSFTNKAITKAILEKELYDGINVLGVIDARGVTDTTINYQLIDWVKVNIGKRRIHTKIFRLGEELSITGSMNPTETGVQLNNENILLIKSKEVNKAYESFIKNYAMQNYNLNGRTYY